MDTKTDMARSAGRRSYKREWHPVALGAFCVFQIAIAPVSDLAFCLILFIPRGWTGLSLPCGRTAIMVRHPATFLHGGAVLLVAKWFA